MSNEKLKVNSEKMNFVRLSRCRQLLPIRRSQTTEPGNNAYQLKGYNAGIVRLPTAQLRLLTNSDWGIVQTPFAQLGERNKSYFLQNFI